MKTNKLEIDLTKQEGVDVFFEDFGGLDIAKKKYPALYKAVLATPEKLKMRNEASQNSDDSKNIGFNMGAIHIENTPNEIHNLNSAVKANLNECVECGSSATVKEATMIMVTTELTDLSNGVMIDSDSSYIEYTDLESSVQSKLSEIGEFNDHEIEARSKFYYVYPDGICGSSHIKTSNYTIVNGQSIVKEFVVDNPRIKVGNESNKHINILYDRSPKNGEKTDYSYKGKDISVSGNLVKTVIPISGHFKLAKGFTPKGLSSVIGLQLIYKEEEVVEYTYSGIEELNNYFTIEEDAIDDCKVVSFDFDKDWKANLDKSKYCDGTYITDCKLRWSFRYDCYTPNSTENIMEIGLCINSESTAPSGGEYNKSNRNKVVIPDIYIQWGCFHKDTVIKMEGGISKKIKDVEIGEYIVDNKGKKVEVTEIYKGKDEHLTCIETETGKMIKVSSNHPIYTEIGMVIASKLSITALIHTEDGPERIENITIVDYNDDSYNIECNGAYIVANGIVAGDFTCQNKHGKVKKEVNYSDETLAIMDDLKRMSDDFNARNERL